MRGSSLMRNQTGHVPSGVCKPIAEANFKPGRFSPCIASPWPKPISLPCTHITDHCMIVPTPEWERFAGSIDRGSIYLLGASDTGKSTFCRYLVACAASVGPVAYLDGDTGQSTIGPPTTAGLAIYDGDPDTPVAEHFRFVGDVSPRGHLLPEITALKRLQEKARRCHPRLTIIDSPGYVHGDVAREYQFHQIDLLQPDHLIALEEHDELEEILALFRRHPAMRVHRFTVSPLVKKRSREWRQRYREERFGHYFFGAVNRELSIRGIGFHGRVPGSFRQEDWQNLLIALCDPEQDVLALGLVNGIDPSNGSIRVFGPAFERDRLSSVHVGSIRLDPEGWGMVPVD
jgi:polynucleotide 5'-hydroxyl-kinase GRC3/NOL9